MIVHLTSDLMATSELKAEAKSKGLEVKVVGTASKATPLLGSATELLVIDLQTRDLELGEFLDGIPEEFNGQVLAYAQHVHDELINSARAHGLQNVMTRGQFSGSVHEMVARVAEISETKSS